MCDVIVFLIVTFPLAPKQEQLETPYSNGQDMGHLSQTTTVTDTDRDTQALSANMGSPVWSTDVSLRLQQMAPNVGLRMHSR